MGVSRVGAYVICLDADRRLLLCRLSDRTSYPGHWSLPGGGIEFGEHPADAALREVREETGLDVEIGTVEGVDSIARTIVLDDGSELPYHAVRIVYRARVVGGRVQHEVDGSTDRAEWLTRDELRTLPLTDTARYGIELAYGVEP